MTAESGPEERALLRTFFNPSTPLEFLPWTGRPAGPGLYVETGRLADPRAIPEAVFGPGHGVVRLSFDPEETIRKLVLETEHSSLRPWHSRLPVKSSWIPSAVRELLLRVSLKGKLSDPSAFPRWPVESAVEDIRALVLDASRKAGLAGEPEPVWPGGNRYAAVLSHDVDGAEACLSGYWKAFAELEEAHGLRSSWHFCTEHLQEAAPVIEELARRGHEIAWHGPRHDYGFAFLPEEKIAARALANRDFFARWGVRGFRSPNFLRTPALYRGLGKILGYDSSPRDTAAELFSSPARRGCCTVFPFFRDGMVVLPVTVPDDLSIRCLAGDSAEEIFRIQLAKMEWIRGVGGMALVLTHPERWISMRPGSFAAYRKLVEFISRDSGAWKPLARDVEARWRSRFGGKAGPAG